MTAEGDRLRAGYADAVAEARAYLDRALADAAERYNLAVTAAVHEFAAADAAARSEFWEAKRGLFDAPANGQPALPFGTDHTAEQQAVPVKP